MNTQLSFTVWEFPTLNRLVFGEHSAWYVANFQSSRPGHDLEWDSAISWLFTCRPSILGVNQEAEYATFGYATYMNVSLTDLPTYVGHGNFRHIHNIRENRLLRSPACHVE